VQKIKPFFLGRIGVVLHSLVLCFFIYGYFLPASDWMDVKSVHVSNAKENGRIGMAAARTIKQDFTATWIATVYEVRLGELYWVCAGSDTSSYRKNVKLPTDLDLLWWTGKCSKLAAGNYIVKTSWLINTPWYMPVKLIESDSNIFEVTK